MIRTLMMVVALALATPVNAQIAGPPSILSQCMDKQSPGVIAGPSSRARECTRQYCGSPEYQAKVRAYAMSQPQSASEQKEALTCITRKEQDMRAAP